MMAEITYSYARHYIVSDVLYGDWLRLAEQYSMTPKMADRGFVIPWGQPPSPLKTIGHIKANLQCVLPLNSSLGSTELRQFRMGGNLSICRARLLKDADSFVA